jgi:hypothetical protein
MKRLVAFLLALASISAFSGEDKCMDRTEAKKVCIQGLLDHELGGQIDFNATRLVLGPVLEGVEIVAIKCDYFTKLSGSSLGDIDVIGTIVMDKDTCKGLKHSMGQAESL